MSKNIGYYMNLHYPFLVAGNNKEGYVASAIDLTGCLTYGDTMEELMENIQDAKRAWLEAAMEMGVEIPEPSRF